MTRAVGIDLGTTNSLIGYSWRGRETIILDPQSNREWVPSLVGLGHQDELLVGHSVESLVEAQHPTGVHSVKRLMGRRWEDAEVQRLISEHRLFYDILEHPDQPGEIGVRLGDRVLTPVEVSSVILRHLRSIAREQGGEEVSHAVITVPAYFRDPAIYATREAGRLAGLRVKHVMPEPTAAAMAYGADELDDGNGRYVLVFDFGGGTFDVSVILVAAGVLNVLRVGGDNFLGGDDVDRVVMQRFDDQLRSAHGASILRGTGLSASDTENLRNLQWRLKILARQAKEAIASTELATVVRPSLLTTSAGQLVNATWSLSRADLMTLAAPYVDRAMDAVGTAMEEANLKPSDIHQVVVAGGSSRLPGVLDRIRALFPDSEVLNTVNPMTAIALGAVRTSRAPFPWSCPACGRDNEIADATCAGCGAAAPAELHACERCGALMSVTEQVCPSPQCATRASVPVVPVEAISHDYMVQVAGDDAWQVLIGRDVAVHATSAQGTESSPWVDLAASRARMEAIDLPIAQATDDVAEDPEVIATFRVIDSPNDLVAGEKVEVRLHLQGDRLATTEVRIRGRLHATRRLDAVEVAAAAAIAEEADTSSEDGSTDRTWEEKANRMSGWLRLVASSRRGLPATQSRPDGRALVAACLEVSDECLERAAQIDEAVSMDDEDEAEQLIEEANQFLADAISIPWILGLGLAMPEWDDYAANRDQIGRAASRVTNSLRDGSTSDIAEATRALEGVITEAFNERGTGSGPGGPGRDRNLLRRMP